MTISLVPHANYTLTTSSLLTISMPYLKLIIMKGIGVANKKEYKKTEYK